MISFLKIKNEAQSKNPRFVFFFALILGFCIQAFSADRYWIATSTGSWNSTSNWSTSATGAGGASVPGASDAVFFTSSRNGDCNINATVNVSALTIQTGHTGTITQNSNSITTSGNFSIAGGTFLAGSSNITING
jgi:hypothetical protein